MVERQSSAEFFITSVVKCYVQVGIKQHIIASYIIAYLLSYSRSIFREYVQ